jgi:hypothetical protein
MIVRSRSAICSTDGAIFLAYGTCTWPKQPSCVKATVVPLSMLATIVIASCIPRRTHTSPANTPEAEARRRDDRTTTINRGVIEGVVVDKSAVPAWGVFVTISSSCIPERLRETITDAKGEFRFESLPAPCPYRVVFSGYMGWSGSTVSTDVHSPTRLSQILPASSSHGARSNTCPTPATPGWICFWFYGRMVKLAPYDSVGNSE